MRTEIAWHESGRFGLHFDVHAKSWEVGLGTDLDEGELRDMLVAVEPDFVQCDSKGHEGLTTWHTETGETAPGLAQDSLAVYRRVTRALGLPLIVHYSGVWDEAAIRTHPSWGATGPDGRVDTMATCRTSGYDEELMIPQLEEIVRTYAVDGIWVDGENWAATPCWCHSCIDEFRRRAGFAGAIPKYAGQPHWEDWRDFHRSLFNEHVAKYTAAIRELDPSCTVVSNWMHSLRQPDVPQPSGIDYISGDFHYAFGIEEALPEAVFLDGRGRSWDLMVWAFTKTEAQPSATTMKQLEQLRQEAAIILSRGGAVALYDQPTRRGRHLAWHTPLLAEVSRFCKSRADIPSSSSNSEALILLNNRAHYVSAPSLFAYSVRTNAVRGAVYALYDQHITCDVGTFEEQPDLDRYSAVIVPEQGDIGHWAPQLRTYVESGGHLVVTGDSVASLNEQLTGVRLQERPTYDWVYAAVDATATTPVPGPWPSMETVTASTLVDGNFEDFDPAGIDERLPRPAIVVAAVNSVLRGTVVTCPGRLFGGFFETRYPRTRTLIETLCRRPGNEPALIVGAPPWVHVTLRRTQGGEPVVHIVNTATGYPLSPGNVSVEGVAAAGPITLTLRTEHPPSHVAFYPGDAAVEWSHSHGRSSVRIDGLDVHVALYFASHTSLSSGHLAPESP